MDDEVRLQPVGVFSAALYEKLIEDIKVPEHAYVYKKHFVPAQMLKHVDTIQEGLFSDMMTSSMSIVSKVEQKDTIDLNLESGNIHFSRSIDISQLPSDQAKKQQFISDQLKNVINLSWYGAPSIAEDQLYQKTSNQDANFWYPFLIDGKEVLDEFGQELGLSVFFSYKEQKLHVQGFIGRFPYETSVYPLAYTKTDILDVIEKMYHRSAPNFSPKRVKFAYIVAKHAYSQDEYMLPSLVFTGEVGDTPFYVPLTKELYE